MAQQQATWAVVLGGLVLPGLRCGAKHLTGSNGQRTFEVEAALLWQLAEALQRGPRDAQRLARELLRLAQAARARGDEAGCCRRAGQSG